MGPPWAPPSGSLGDPWGPGVKPFGPFNRQNGGHSDLEGEKLVYNSLSLVSICDLNVSKKGRGVFLFRRLRDFPVLEKIAKSSKQTYPPYFLETFMAHLESKERNLYTSKLVKS